MKRMKIQIAVLIPALTAIIIGITIMTTVVGISSSNIVTGLTSRLMEATVDKHSNELTGLLAEVYSTATGAASTIAGYLPGGHLRTFDDIRSLAIGILTDILKSNSNIICMWTAWEPNAFDGIDMIWANQLFYDDTGRFIPAIYRDGDEYIVEALVNYDDPVAGDYYQGVLRSGRPHLTNPYTYYFGDNLTLLCSIAIPVIQSGRVIGAVGADMLIDELFGMVNTSTVLDDGYLFVISSDGSFAAHPDDNFRMTNYIDSWMNAYSDLIENILNGSYYSFNVDAHIDELRDDVSFLGTSLTIGDTGTYWMVGVIVPKKTIMASSNALLSGIIAIGISLVLTVGIIIYTVVHREQLNKQRLDDLEKAVETEKIASQYKTNFLANMSHEIRTPMNAITGMAELLLRRDLPEDAKNEVQDIKQASTNLLSIINDILDFSKIESGKLEIIPVKYTLSSLVNDTVNIIRMRIMEKPIEFITNIDSKISNNLFGDVVRLRQIILNLLSNAVKFTDSGHISMSIGIDNETANQIWLKITINDTGHGIKPEDQAKLFSNFMQLETKRNRSIEGTGLGLAITKQLCDAMGGSISVTSEYGAGSEFTVIIPQDIDPDAVLDSYAVRNTGHFTIPKARILVVDDIATNLKVAEGLLAPYQATVDSCLSGAEAIELVKQKDYDLIFMDHMMSEMDGIETTAIIRAWEDEFFRTVPIIALTANAVAGMREMFLEKGFNDFLAKPIDISRLDEMLDRWIPSEKREQKKKLVLLVDDNPANLRFGVNVLRKTYNIITAPSAEKMFSLLETNNPDIILMNADMHGSTSIPEEVQVILITEPFNAIELINIVENHFKEER